MSGRMEGGSGLPAFLQHGAGRDGRGRAASVPASGARPPAAPVIEVRDLTFTYPGAERPVLSRLSWSVPAGSFALLVGGTGSGKSTLLSLLKSEIAPAGERSGSLSALGAPVGTLPRADAAAGIGYVFQNPDNQLVCESVWHEMAFGLENLGVPQAEMRRLVAETSYFFGMEEWFRRETDTLSGGRKQLLALASTLVMQPRLLLLDEPTAQLDPIAEKTFLHALFRVNRELGCTVVVATHRPQAMVPYATCAFELVDGRLREVADLAALERQPRLLPPFGEGGDGAPAAVAPAAPASPTPPAPRRAAPAAARFSRVWFRYGRAGDWVLRNLELEVRPGRIHALVGGNGSGKSTLLSLMAGINKLNRGSLALASSARALLPQDPRAVFAEETVADELMEWAAATGYAQREADAMLDRVGLTGLAALHPHDLSGGQQQLLALAKLLLTRPRLLLLDEPSKGLDLTARRRVAALLREAADGGADVVLATHDLDFVSQVVDDVSMVFDGEIACTSPREEFFAGNVYYRP
ncbi:MAG: ATP-binding cassette domain-containing protein [Collinsella sp.]|nr:ATP-binding cassette domain-containing protein [Collinsella sp.]